MKRREKKVIIISPPYIFQQTKQKISGLDLEQILIVIDKKEKLAEKIGRDDDQSSSSKKERKKKVIEEEKT